MKNNFKSLKKLEEFLIKYQSLKILNFKITENCFGDNFDQLVSKYGYKISSKKIKVSWSNDGYEIPLNPLTKIYEVVLDKGGKE
jgi:hypothetical protein